MGDVTEAVLEFFDDVPTELAEEALEDASEGAFEELLTDLEELSLSAGVSDSESVNATSGYPEAETIISNESLLSVSKTFPSLDSASRLIVPSSVLMILVPFFPTALYETPSTETMLIFLRNAAKVSSSSEGTSFLNAASYFAAALSVERTNDADIGAYLPLVSST